MQRTRDGHACSICTHIARTLHARSSCIIYCQVTNKPRTLTIPNIFNRADRVDSRVANMLGIEARDRVLQQYYFLENIVTWTGDEGDALALGMTRKNTLIRVKSLDRYWKSVLRRMHKPLHQKIVFTPYEYLFKQNVKWDKRCAQLCLKSSALGSIHRQLSCRNTQWIRPIEHVFVVFDMKTRGACEILFRHLPTKYHADCPPRYLVVDFQIQTHAFKARFGYRQHWDLFKRNIQKSLGNISFGLSLRPRSFAASNHGQPWPATHMGMTACLSGVVRGEPWSFHLHSLNIASLNRAEAAYTSGVSLAIPQKLTRLYWKLAIERCMALLINTGCDMGVYSFRVDPAFADGAHAIAKCSQMRPLYIRQQIIVDTFDRWREQKIPTVPCVSEVHEHTTPGSRNAKGEYAYAEHSQDNGIEKEYILPELGPWIPASSRLFPNFLFSYKACIQDALRVTEIEFSIFASILFHRTGCARPLIVPNMDPHLGYSRNQPVHQDELARKSLLIRVAPWTSRGEETPLKRRKL
jgi:hypothetical protein